MIMLGFLVSTQPTYLSENPNVNLYYDYVGFPGSTQPTCLSENPNVNLYYDYVGFSSVNPTYCKSFHSKILQQKRHNCTCRQTSHTNRNTKGN
jgi:hypothetical protein